MRKWNELDGLGTRRRRTPARAAGIRAAVRSVCERLETRQMLAVYFVDAASGNDAFTGLSLTVGGANAGPFRTVQRAATLAVAGDTVQIRGGTYRETVTPANSGTAASPITFQPYNNEVVTISGADVISGWVLSSGSVYRAPMSFTMGGKDGQDDQLFVNGESMVHARWPNSSLDLLRPTWDVAEAGTTGSLSGTVLTGRIVDWSLNQPAGTWTGAVLHLNPGPQWLWETPTVTGYTPATATAPGTITYTSAFQNAGYLPVAGNPYWLSARNSVVLDAPGEYFRDAAAGQMHAWMPDGSNPSTKLVEAKRRQWAFELSGRRHIHVTGIKLFAAGVNMSATSGTNVMTGIDARYVAHFQSYNGNFGAKLLDNGIILAGGNNTVRDSHVNFSAGNGVVVMGNNNTVTNNYIHNVNYVGADTSGISSNVTSPTSGNTITFNTLSDSKRGLITWRGMRNSRIAHNRLFNAMLSTTDGGAIYNWNAANTGVTIDRNVISDSVNFLPGNASTGIFLDGATTGTTVARNLVYNTGTGIKQNDANGPNVYYNNTIATSPQGLMVYGTIPGGSIVNNLTTGQVLYPTTNATIGSNITVTTLTTTATSPGFASPAAADFSLIATSTAVNTGSVVAGWTDGAVGAAPDVGAYEFGSNAFSAGAGAAVTAMGGLPAAPSNLVLTVVSSTQVNLAWTNNATNATRFVIDRSADGTIWSQLATVGPATTAYSDTTANIGIYFYRVRADNGWTTSPYTTVVSARTGRDPFNRNLANSLDAHQGLNVGVSNVGSLDNRDWARYDGMDFGSRWGGLFTINLAVPATQAGQTIQLRLDSTTGTLIGSLVPQSTGSFGAYAEQSVNISPVTGRRTLFLVGVGTSGISNFQYFFFTAIPAAPSALTAVATSTSSVSLTWADNATNETSVVVERATDVAFTQNLTTAATLPAGATSFTDTGLAAGTTYFYRVGAANIAGSSSTVAPVTTSVVTFPTAPTITAFVNDNGTSTTDRITNLNNSVPGRALQFGVSGLFAGATVRLLDGSNVIGTGVAAGGTLTITTNGATTLADGTRDLSVVQVLAGNTSAASGAFAVTVDTAAPTVVLAGTPSGVTASSVPSAALAFSESVAGVGLPSLTLTRDGAGVTLSGDQLPTTADGATWTVPGLASPTSRPGSYVLSLSAAGIIDLAGNALLAGASSAWAKNTLDGTAAADEISVTFTSATTASIVVSGAAAYSVDLAPLPSLAIVGAGGSDLLSLSGVAPAVPLRLAGTLAVSAGVSLPDFTVTGTGSVVSAARFSATRVSVEAGATLRLTGGTSVASEASSLSVAAGGVFDVGSSAMVVRGGTASVEALRAMLASGRLTTSTTSVPHTTVSLFANTDGGATVPYFTEYGGVASLAGTDLIVKYTYAGDSNLDGRMDGRDLARAVQGFSVGSSGWNAGDADHSGGPVTAADLGAVSAAIAYFTNQNGPDLGAGGGAGPVPITGPITGPAPMSRPAPVRLAPAGLSRLVIVRGGPSLVRVGASVGKIELAVMGADGTPLPTSNARVRVELTRVSGSARLLGTRALRLIAGRATFADLRVSAPGTYRLTFVAPGLGTLTTDTFVVSPRARG